MSVIEFPPADDDKPSRRPKQPGMDFSDEDVTRAFVVAYGDRLRYVAGGGGWHVWNGAFWEADAQGRAFAFARKHCYAVAKAAKDPFEARRIKSAGTVAAIVKMARHDEAIAILPDAFDAHLWILNTPGGIVDLRTGEMMPHDPALLLTRMTAVAPEGDCPRFLQFLDEATGGDNELALFIQRVFGYSLTGSIREHALFFIHGPGGSGKTTLVLALADALGSFHQAAPMESFVSVFGDRQTNDIAGLIGSRLVTAAETEKGRRWAEQRIKTMTGGDPMTVRALYQEFRTFRPSFKIIIYGNDKPAFTDVDEAIRRRLHLIPLDRVVEGGAIDKDLPDKLRAEAPGILRWMLEGCLDWQRRGGLEPPEVVRLATEDYLADEDVLSIWIRQRCEFRRGVFTSTSDLHKSYAVIARENGETPWSVKTFSSRLKAFAKRDTRIEKTETRSANGFVGLFIRPNPTRV